MQACILHVYCWKRERAFFAKTKFMVDRLHFKNHKGCCEGYCLESWRDDTPVISEEDMVEVGVRLHASAAGAAAAAALVPLVDADALRLLRLPQVRAKAALAGGWRVPDNVKPITLKHLNTQVSARACGWLKAGSRLAQGWLKAGCRVC